MRTMLNRPAQDTIKWSLDVTATDDRQDFYLGEILVAPQHNRISLGERALKLQPKVMAVLTYLARHQERVIGAEELMDELWKGRVVTPSSVQKSINSLRNTLAELAADQEFVAHFSKRGYQLVLPARFLESAEAEKAATEAENPVLPLAAKIKPQALVGLLLVLGLSVWVLFWVMLRPREIEVPPHLHLKEFQSSRGFTSEVGHERSSEPHPDGDKVAYVRVTDTAGAVQSQILIRDRDGRDWVLAGAEGTWTNLAWSPSGRNLVAVEMRRAEDVPRSPAFYETPNYLYSFHIFTLDFSGRRLLEKNLLSQWQGVIESVTWWDENTLEFVASQGPNSSNERYRYVIAEQRLSMLNPLESGFTPQLSVVREKLAAVVSRRGNSVQVEFLNAQQKPLSTWPITTSDLEISWIPDGSGVLLLEKDSTDLFTLYLNGDTSPIQFPHDPSLSISQPRYRSHGQSILIGAASNRTSLNWLDLQGNLQTLSRGNYNNSLPRFSPDATQIVFTSTRNNQHQIWTLHQGVEQLLVTTDKPVTQIVWSKGDDFVLYRSGQNIWLFEFGSSAPRLLEEKVTRLEPLAYIPETQNLWVAKQVGDARNIWQKSRTKQTEKQLTFGSVAAVLAHRGKVYFQYLNQRGLWVLSSDTSNPQAVSTQLPENSRLLRLVDGGVYFVSGGACRESDIQYLDFAADSVTTALRRARGNVVSHDFHPAAGALQVDCALPESNIIELFPQNPPR
jgi:DNA-binding winged helix-turn-helix (wHTH) protein